jgi:hypothetical protein
MKLKRVCLTVVLMTVVAAHVGAGELSVIGNMNVASNLTVGQNIALSTDTNFVDFAGQMHFGRFDPNDLGQGIAVHRSNDAYICAMMGWWLRTAVQAYSNSAAKPTELALNPNGGQVTVGAIGRYDGFNVATNTVFERDVEILGKLDLDGGSDPPYLLLNVETRDRIAQRVAGEVPPSKQSGAALFWNSQTKQLEVYVASEGMFYDLTGKALVAIAPPVVKGATVTSTFRIDPQTGAVVTHESVQAPRWQLKPGYQFDRLTGSFTQLGSGSNASPVAVSAQEALELK